MTTKQIMELDCRDEDNQQIIQKVLRQIKPLAKCPEGQMIPVTKLERCLKVICNKYTLFVRNMFPDVYAADTEIVWRSVVVDLTTLEEHVAYGCTFYECISKTIILLYSRMRKRDEQRQSKINQNLH